jgi:hypothetical protein
MRAHEKMARQNQKRPAPEADVPTSAASLQPCEDTHGAGEASALWCFTTAACVDKAVCTLPFVLL